MQPQRLKTRRRVFNLVLIVLGVPILLAVILAIYFWRFPPLNRESVVEALEKRYQCDIELKSFSVSYFPAVSITGEGLVLKRKERPDLPPVATIGKFSASGDWLSLLRQPRHLGRVRLEGLVIVIPPRQRQAQAKKKQQQQKKQAYPFVLDKVFADGASLSILPANPNKPPHVFEIHKLRLQSAGIGQPMYFQATLTNPIPVGQIQSSGRFGPWDTDDPSLTPLSGKYTFSRADLSTIRGLGEHFLPTAATKVC